MRRNDDEIVECPFDSSHKMPLPRLQWHLANKCKAKQAREEMNLPIFYCKHNFQHVFFDDDSLADHLWECPSKPKPSLGVDGKNNLTTAKTTWDMDRNRNPIDLDWRNQKKQAGLINRTMPIGATKVWDGPTAEDERSPDSVEQEFSDKSSETTKEESHWIVLFKGLIVWFMTISAVMLIYAISRDLDKWQPDEVVNDVYT